MSTRSGSTTRKQKPVTFTLDAETIHLLRVQAAADGRSVSGWVRELVRRHHAAVKPPFSTSQFLQEHGDDEANYHLGPVGDGNGTIVMSSDPTCALCESGEDPGHEH